MKKSKHKGLFITFEGGDGAGKSTLIKKLYSYLEKKKYAVIPTRAPGGTEIGEDIRNLILHKHTPPLSLRAELLLFLADRAQHVDEFIFPHLNQGKIVLCDRFTDSTIAYQSGARGFNETLVNDLCYFAAAGLHPDLTLYLDLDPKIGFERTQETRLSKDRIESEHIQFHQRIRKAFRKIAKNDPKRFIMIDASQTPEKVYAEAKKRIDAILKTHRK